MMETFSSQSDCTLSVIKDKNPSTFEVEQTVKTPASGKTLTLDSKTKSPSHYRRRVRPAANAAPAGGHAGRGG